MGFIYKDQPENGVGVEARRESFYVNTKDKMELVAYEDGYVEIGKKTMKALVDYFNKFPDRLE